MQTTIKAPPSEIRAARRAFWNSVSLAAVEIQILRDGEGAPAEKLKEALRFLREVSMPPPGRGYLTNQITATSEIVGALHDLLEDIARRLDAA